MENKSNISITIAKIVVLLICAVNVVCNIIYFFEGQRLRELLGVVLNCLSVYYMFVAYKKPHGNLLRYLLILVTLEFMFAFWYSLSLIGKTVDIYDLFPLLEMIIVAYISGRLDKYKENIALFVIALALLLSVGIHAITIFNPTDLIQAIVPFDKFTILFALFISYIARYKEHKEVGLADK